MFKVYHFYTVQPEEITVMLENFISITTNLQDIVSVTNYMLGVQKAAPLMIAGERPSVEYQFHYIIVYTTLD